MVGKFRKDLLLSGYRWIPESLAECVFAWYSELGITKDGVNRVSSWIDQKNGYDLVQATDSKKFVWTANQINGYPILRHDGIDDWMVTSGNVVLPTAMEIFVVLKIPTGNVFFVEHSPTANTNPGFYLYSENNARYNVYRDAALHQDQALPGWIGYDAFKIVSHKYNGSTSPYFWPTVNGQAIALGNILGTPRTNSNILDLLNLGSRNQGEIILGGSDTAAMLGFSLLSGAVHNQVENFLNTKYAVY